MRPLLPIVAALAFAAFLPGPADAQIAHSALTLTLDPPEQAFTNDLEVMTLRGTTTFTGDLLQYQHTNGIPIQYTVTMQPAWLTVSVSPAQDVMPLPAAPTGLTMVIMRSFEVTLILSPDATGDMVDQVEIHVTQGPSFGSSPSTAKGAVPVVAHLEDEEPCTLEGHEDLLRAAAEIADSYDEQTQMREASRADASAPELHVQDAATSPVALPWLAIGGTALVGAGIGLALRRRFAP